MPRTCSICNNSSRKQIDAALAGGEPIRGISQKYRVSQDALYRHKTHVAEAVTRASEAREVSVGETVLKRLESLYIRASKILDQAESAGDLRTALAGIHEARELLGGLFRLASETAPASTQRRLSYTELLEKACEFYGVVEPL